MQNCNLNEILSDLDERLSECESGLESATGMAEQAPTEDDVEQIACRVVEDYMSPYGSFDIDDHLDYDQLAENVAQHMDDDAAEHVTRVKADMRLAFERLMAVEDRVHGLENRTASIITEVVEIRALLVRRTTPLAVRFWRKLRSVQWLRLLNRWR